MSDAAAVRVADAAEAAAADRAATDAGVPSRALMQRAGAAAAAEIARCWPARLAGGVAVFAGTGNNGGDAWVVARALAMTGVPVRVHAPAEPRTADAAAERRLALEVVGTEGPRGDERIVVDGVLGTGATGAPRGAVAEAIARMRTLRAGGARIAALDVP
ncbi:MAG TPA: NAD(P)H-hydrate epimerase, partial [Gemmatimonadaceae bacterium]|nr:NAD(P)H-hydrate epimerase [Gemmatimonadaceae bacterium]